MKTIIHIILAVVLCTASSTAQEIREAYKATSSYDINVFNKVTDKETGKIYRELKTKARVYYNENNDFVIIEQLEANNDKPLELSVIDFSNGSHIILKDKANQTALIKSYAKPEIPSYMKKEYDLQMGEEEERDGLSVMFAKYIVKDQYPEVAEIELTPQVKAPSYLNWMPILQDDLAGHFPLKTDYKKEGKGGMMTETIIETSEFRNENPFNFATIELKFQDQKK